MTLVPVDLYNNGYIPLSIIPFSKNPGFEGWQTVDPLIQISAGWPSNKHGIGIRTGDHGHAGLDIDIYNAELVNNIRNYLLLFFPGIVSRTGQAPKILVPVVCHELKGKMVSKRYRDPSNNTINAVEVLSHGQQYIHTGIHPDTLQPYTWSAPLPPLNELPVVTLAQLQMLFSYFEMEAEKLGWVEIVTPPSVKRKEQTAMERMYNHTFNVNDLLTQYGWVHLEENRWVRPGKTSGVGGTVTENTFYCFTSTSMLEPMMNHRPWDLVTAYAFNGDEELMIEHARGVLDQQAQEVFINPPITPSSPVEEGIEEAESDEIETGWNAMIRQGKQYMQPDNQMQFFNGCYYINDIDKILVPNGMMLNQSQFNNRYGGWEFILDPNFDKTIRESWKIFTNSQAIDFPKVDHACFLPKYPYGTVHRDSLGHRQVNTYIPSKVKSVPGNVEPFLNHLTLLLPNEHDRLILLCYMAACVQYIGTKFQWAPLIQGIQGNGKSLITSCIQEAIGSRYCHSPNPADISNKFNAWIENKLMIIIEEIKVAGKWEVMEILKPMITQMTQEVQGKGKDQRIAYICANFIFCSNHKDALIKTKDDRRYAPFFTAQQLPGDIERDGMTNKYFKDIYNWLRKEGYAHVTNYLQTLVIPDEMNPATDCQRAPETSSTTEAITFSFGNVEQEIFNAIEEETPGFMGGWVSSMAVDKLLKEKGLRKSRNHRLSMFDEMGYVRHPGLTNGRASVKNLIDGGRPILYVKKGHLNSQLKGAAINTAYISSQGMPGAAPNKTQAAG